MKKVHITAVATAALLVALGTAPVMAGTSATTISKGTVQSYGPYQTLAAKNVTCRGTSYSSSDPSNIMSSNLLTKGTTFEVLKSDRDLYPGDSARWTWANSSLTGQFRVWLHCYWANHNGNGSMAQ